MDMTYRYSIPILSTCFRYSKIVVLSLTHRQIKYPSSISSLTPESPYIINKALLYIFERVFITLYSLFSTY